MKALHELRCMSIFCFEEYQKTKNIDWKDRRKAIEEAIIELEEYQSDMDKYLDYTTGGRCSKSFNSNLAAIKQAHDKHIESLIKES